MLNFISGLSSLFFAWSGACSHVPIAKVSRRGMAIIPFVLQTSGTEDTLESSVLGWSRRAPFLAWVFFSSSGTPSTPRVWVLLRGRGELKVPDYVKLEKLAPSEFAGFVSINETADPKGFPISNLAFYECGDTRILLCLLTSGNCNDITNWSALRINVSLC